MVLQLQVVVVVIVVRLLWQYFYSDCLTMYLMTNISVILLTGGSGTEVAVELLHTNGTRICSLPDLPSNRRGHVQAGYTVCGGHGSPGRTSCHTLSSTGSWVLSHNLARDRVGHSAWASPQGTILLGTGTTSEILLESGGTTRGFNLDYYTR